MTGEVVTDIYFDFGTVPSGFQSVTKPTLMVSVNPRTANKYYVTNRADAGGKFGETWQSANASWIKQGKTTVSYKKINTNGTTREQQICMTEYIRHQIHHPENTYHARFNDLQLRRSIEDMRAFVTSKAQTSGTT